MTTLTPPVCRKAIRSWFQGWRVFCIKCQRQLVIVAYFCLLFAETHSSRSQWYLFWNSDISTSQSALKQSYTEKTNGQNNDDKVKKPTLSSYSISVNYCNILYFSVTNNKFKAALIVLRSWSTFELKKCISKKLLFSQCTIPTNISTYTVVAHHINFNYTYTWDTVSCYHNLNELAKQGASN